MRHAPLPTWPPHRHGCQRGEQLPVDVRSGAGLPDHAVQPPLRSVPLIRRHGERGTVFEIKNNLQSKDNL
jgi:hypothetical protein